MNQLTQDDIRAKPPRETIGSFTDSRAQLFLHELANSGLPRVAASIVNVSIKDINKKLKSDPLFEEDYNNAIQFAYDKMEAEAYRRAVTGYDEELSYKGEKTGDVVTRYSDSLLIFLLKGRRSDVFKDKVESDTKIGISEDAANAIRSQIGNKLLRGDS